MCSAEYFRTSRFAIAMKCLNGEKKTSKSVGFQCGSDECLREVSLNIHTEINSSLKFQSSRSSLPRFTV